MLGRPQEYTGPWGKNTRVSWDESVKGPYSMGRKLQGVTHLGGGHYSQQKSAMQTVEDLPWFMQGEGGGTLGRRRAEVEGINPQEIYGLSAPSVRKTTEGLMSGIEEDAARRNLSPAMAAMARKSLLRGELEGLGSAAGQAASGAYGLKETARSDLFKTETSLGQSEMAGRRGVTASRIPLKMQSRRFAREDTQQRESQARLKSFWQSYGM